jgi:predicted MPP superfamily phosphohydrolase
MKVKFMSDLHLEFGGPEFDPGHGEILILAGDIVCARNLHGANPASSPYGGDYLRFFDKVSKQYDRAFMVMGNHEHYGHNVDKSYDDIRRNLPDNIRLMEDEAEVIDGWMFIGSTLWTDGNKKDSLTLWHMNRGMNDFRIIRKGDGSRPFQAEDSVIKHETSCGYISRMLSEAAAANQKAFVITHHAPHENSVDAIYKGDMLNGAFRSDLSDIMLDRPQLKYWVHGHMHNTSDYMIGECRVMANPRGYWPREMNKRFDLEWTVEL